MQASSVFGRELDLPSLGVDFPSGDELQNFLSKGKSRVENAKKKVQELAHKKKKKSNGDDVEVVDNDAEGEDTGGDGGGLVTGEEGGGGASVVIDKPYFETTYVDDDLRIGRTGQGDFFVSARA